MAKLNTWIRAARLRTLLLSFSGVLLGGFLAIKIGPSTGSGTWLCLLFCALTAILLQVLSNLANDYGDFKKAPTAPSASGHSVRCKAEPSPKKK